MKNIHQNRKEIYIFVAVCIGLLLLAVGMRIYFGAQKEAFHLDEIYTYQFVGGGEKVMPHWDDSLLNVWHNGTFFSDYITIDEAEKFDFIRVSNKTAQDVHPPFYYWLFHISTVLVDSGEMNFWGGHFLNIISFIVSALLLFLLSYKILKDKYLALITCVLWGFGLAVVSDAIFLRMYSVLTTVVIGVVLAHYYFIVTSKLTWKIYSALILGLIIGLLTHYYFLFLFLPLVFYTIAKTFFEKKYWKTFTYLLLVVMSTLISYIIFPAAKEHLFFSYRSQEMVESIKMSLSDKIALVVDRFNAFNTLFNDQVFTGVLIVILALLVGAFIKYIFRVGNKKLPEFIFILPILSLFWLGIVLYAAPFASLRYVIPVVPLLLLSMVVLLDYLISSIRIKYMLLGVCVFSTVFLLFTGDIGYTYDGASEKWENISSHRSTPILIISPKKRIFTINAINPYLTDREQIYVTTVERSSDLISRGDLDLHENTDKCVYLFIEKGVIDKLDFSEYGTMKFLFSHAYYDIYELIIDSN